MNGVRARLTLLLCALAAMLLAGCYPELDWRELRSSDGGFAVMFPARPNEVTREVALNGTTIRLHMLSTEINEMAFGVGYADLPTGIDGNVLLGAARDGFVRNIDGRISNERPVTAPGLNGLEFHADGTVQGRPMIVAARVLVGANRFYQVLFIGPRDRAADVDLNFYLGSFALTAL